MAYSRDTEVKLRFETRNGAGDLADPTDLFIQVRTPAGVVTTYVYSQGQAVRESLGVFTKLLLLDQEGDWAYRGKATGALKASGWKLITVGNDPFA